jgi:pimeloyl-ACP methyl ester carboxylesterase
MRPSHDRKSVFAASQERNESSDLTGSRLLWSAPVRASIVALTILGAMMPGFSRSVDAVARPATTSAPSSIVIGFVGGFVGHDNRRHGPVQLAQRMQRTVSKDTYIRVFENRHRKQAYDAVLRQLDTNHDGILSAEEKARARIILFGHSWGAAAAVLLARDLRREGIRVLLTVQVDSIEKAWQNDAIIPDNVAEAVNFYQPSGILHGRTQITAADPGKTQVLGNYRMDYRKDPVNCPEVSWFSRVFTSGHVQSECDPHIWSQIEGMMRQRLGSTESSPNASAEVSGEGSRR